MRTVSVSSMSSVPPMQGATCSSWPAEKPRGHLHPYGILASRLARAPLVAGSSQLGRLGLSPSGAHCQAPQRTLSGLDKTPSGRFSYSRSRLGVSCTVSRTAQCRLPDSSLSLLLPRLRPRVDPPRRARSLQRLGARPLTAPVTIRRDPERRLRQAGHMALMPGRLGLPRAPGGTLSSVSRRGGHPSTVFAAPAKGARG